MKPCLAVLFLLSPTSALACFGDTGLSLFHCTFKAGMTEARVCLQDDVVYYAYGAAGASPDLLLARDVGAVDMVPWPGIGRTIWEEAGFSNGDVEYRLTYAVDKMAETEPAEGVLLVRQGGNQIAELICDRGSVSDHDFYPLFEAKSAAGQCWDHDSTQWQDC